MRVSPSGSTSGLGLTLRTLDTYEPETLTIRIDTYKEVTPQSARARRCDPARAASPRAAGGVHLYNARNIAQLPAALKNISNCSPTLRAQGESRRPALRRLLWSDTIRCTPTHPHIYVDICVYTVYIAPGRSGRKCRPARRRRRRLLWFYNIIYTATTIDMYICMSTYCIQLI